MLKLKAALVSLVLGTSSVALASPGVTFTANANASFSLGPDIRDHRVPSSYRLPGQTSWIQLSAPASLRFGRAVIRPEVARISQLRLQAGRGMTYVGRVELRFRDGSSQTLTVNRWLTLASSIDLPLRSRGRIDSITIVGSSVRHATIQLLAHGAGRIDLPAYQPPVYQPPVYQPPQPPVYQPPAPPVVQASPAFTLGMYMTFGGTYGMKQMAAGAIKGAFNTLRLEGAGTGVFITRAQIDFSDGTHQFVNDMNKNLAPGEVFDIALDGLNPRSVERVVVWTNDSNQYVYNQTGQLHAALL